MGVGYNSGMETRAEYDARWQRERKKRGNEFLAVVKDVPCLDCHLRWPKACMEFDHRPGETKTYSIGRSGAKLALAALKTEIAKCDIVCANCHRIRTEIRAGRLDGWTAPVIG